MTVSRLTIDDGGAPTRPDSRKPGPEEAIAATQPQNWQARLAEVERKAQARMDERKVDALEVAHEQHLKALRLVLGKGLEALRGMSIESPRDAIRAIGLAVREIRVELGEPSEWTAISVEDTIRSEYERWMVVEDEAEESKAQAAERLLLRPDLLVWSLVSVEATSPSLPTRRPLP